MGHVISERGIEVQDDKIAAVRDWPRPQNLTELRSFVSFCSYYMRFIDDFAGIAAPLYALQKKNVHYVWGDEQEEAFDWLKWKMTRTPILGMPTDTDRFTLDCDASRDSIAAILSQDHAGSEVVIAYASRTLTKPERNYDVTKKSY